MDGTIGYDNLAARTDQDNESLVKIVLEINDLFTDIRSLLNGTFKADIEVHLPDIVTRDRPIHVDVAPSSKPNITGWISFRTNNQQNHRVFGIGMTGTAYELFGDLSAEQGKIILRAIISQIINSRKPSGYVLKYEEWLVDEPTQPVNLPSF